MIFKVIYLFSGKEKKLKLVNNIIFYSLQRIIRKLPLSLSLSLCVIFSLIAFSFGFAITIIILTGFLLEKTFAEYDCSAKDDGWYYDPEFCHVYWRCIHGTSEEFECASGTAWDHHENRCNWLDSIDCSRSETTTSKQELDDDDGGDEGIVEQHSNPDDDSDDLPPTVVVKKRKKKKKKNRKIESNKRMLDGEDNDGGKDREI